MLFLKIFGGAYGGAENFGLHIGKNRYVGRLRRPTSRGVSVWYQNGEVGRLRRPTSGGLVSGTGLMLRYSQYTFCKKSQT